MFINIGKNINNNDGNISNLGNIDYYKRYIIIEVPENDFMKSEITIINISSSTGRSCIGFLSKNERNQNYNIYHATGNVFITIPQIFTKEIKNCINFDSFIVVNDYSYGNHNYNISRQRFDELRTTSSYNNMYEQIISENLIPEQLPYPKFYNIEHHMMNEDVNNYEIPYGNSLINKEIVIKLRDLIDDHTYIYITRKSNYNVISKEIDESSFNVSFEDLSTLIIGPVTNLAISFMVNEIDFCYDSSMNPGLSRIRYKTDHKEPNNLYNTQIKGNVISQFEGEMSYIRDIINFNFRLFVHFMIGNVKLRFIKYDKCLGNIHYDFSYDIGNHRNEEHKNTVEYINTILF